MAFASHLPIKTPGTVVQYDQEMMKELAWCTADPLYFMNNFCYVTGKNGMTLLKTFPYQDMMVDNFQTHKNNILLTARQMGKCLGTETLIKVRNKINGEVMEISIGEFHELQKQQKQNQIKKE